MLIWPAAESLPDLSAHQREQYALATAGDPRLAILGGRPGTGKTFTLARLLGAIPTGNAAVAAPTGKAAVRITESLSRAGISDMRATTIHSLLRVKSSKDGWRFEHDADNHLPLDWIFVDEASMISTSLMGSFLAARREGCRVLLIGDVNQLAPVEHGAPLRDLREILPCGELLEIQRNSGRIVRCCHEIIDRKTFTPSPKLDLEAEEPENLFHVEQREPETQIAALKSILHAFREGRELLGQRIDPVWDVQILVPVNDKSELGRKPLNAMLQAFLNPGGKSVEGHKFRVGDKIVNGKNGYFPCEENIPKHLEQFDFNVDANRDSRGGASIFCCNGDVARVVSLQPRYIVARLWAPDRLIRIPLGNSYENENGEEELEGGNKWELAYALSVHKAQGSEYPVAITILDNYPGARMLCDRSWLYTALSRGKTLSVTIGQRSVAEGMCRKSHIWARKTFLRERIAELREESIGREWEKGLVEL